MVETHPKRRDRGNDLSLSGKRGWWTDGLAPTLAAVRNKLEQPLALGYCHVGVAAAAEPLLMVGFNRRFASQV